MLDADGVCVDLSSTEQRGLYGAAMSANNDSWFRLEVLPDQTMTMLLTIERSGMFYCPKVNDINIC